MLLKCLTDGSLLRSTDLGVSWSKAADLPLSNPTATVFLDGFGTVAYLHTTAGDMFITQDAGVKWRAIANVPKFCQPLVRGNGDRNLLGFSCGMAYESLNAGETWQRIIMNVPGPQGSAPRTCWTFDPVNNIFYYVDMNGKISAYAR